MQSLVHAFRASVKQYSLKNALLSPEARMDYLTLDQQSEALAGWLAEQGITQGDRVALYCPNGFDFPVAYLAILKAGAVVVPINLLLSTDEMIYNLTDAGVKGLIYHEALADAVQPILLALETLAFSLVVTEQLNSTWRQILAGSGQAPSINFNPDRDLAVILYTSGTTGRAKGAMLSHSNLLANVRSVQQAMTWRLGDDTVLVVLPMFHAFAGTVGLLTPLLSGCTITPLARFEPDLVAKTIHAVQATIFLGVPSMYTLLSRLKSEKAYLLESLRFCISGGAALPVEVLHRFEQLFDKRIYEGDGPTECSPVTCVNPVGGLAKPGTVGLPVPQVEMRIVGETGVESLALGEVGEIAVRGPNVMQGYWKQPEATAEVMREGWLLTGDLGTEDEDGYFAIVDRKKDLIIVNGMNVYPRMIEEVLYRHPAIKEAAVVGEPHELHGEIPVAYISLQQPDSANESMIKAHCREWLGRHQVPRKIHILPELPKTATGKLLKRELRKQGEVERGVTGLL